MATLGSLLCAVVGLSAACAEPAPDYLSRPAQRGYREFSAFCTSCHGRDPHRDGYNGPALAGSSAELLRAKVLHGRYPEGYRPKRATGIMPRQPLLKDRIDDIAAYLAEVEPGAP